MKYSLLIAVCLAAVISPVQGQVDPFPDYFLDDLICKEQARAAYHIESGGYRNPASDLTDIHYQEMHWTIDPAVYFIEGQITYHFQSRQNGLDELILDLSDALSVHAIDRNGTPLMWTHGTDQLLRIDLGKTIAVGQLDTVTVRYSGLPPSNGFGSFEQSVHDGAPVIWTLSEPYGARDWWPAKQDLVDKIDSVDIYITTPIGQLAASNGKLMSITPDTARLVHHWRHRYPITAYLIALAVTNYEAYSHFMPLDETDTLEILNYVYPESRVQAEAQTPRTIEIMELFNELFGRYPFADEKYGHAQFGWGGGMEHQTMSFMGNFSHELVAHELAHQWFGNKVTCQSWADIWMNEGFATYLTGLTYERFSPDLYWPAWKRSVINAATSQPGGSVWVNDTTNVNRIFSGRLTYNKGAYLLQMLRWIVGDETFFAACRDYLDLPGTAFAFGSTEEFQAYLEQHSGKDLDGFFSDWFYGEGWPTYTVRWSREPDSLVIWLDQVQSHPSVSFYEMPVPIQVFTQGTGTMHRLDHSANGQRFAIDLAGAQVDSIRFDPELRLLSRNNTVVEITTAIGDPASPDGRLIYPNPTTSFVNIYPSTGLSRIALTDIGGRTHFLSVADGQADVSSLSPGAYMLRLLGSGMEHEPVCRIMIVR